VPGHRATKVFGLVRASRGHAIKAEPGVVEAVIADIQTRAATLGANAVVGFNLVITETTAYAYGTAVHVEPED
jgi:hypothetical protein